MVVGKARKAESQRPCLLFRRGVGKMNFENSARSIGSLRVAGNERRPRTHAHGNRSCSLELRVGNGIVPPIVDTFDLFQSWRLKEGHGWTQAGTAIAGVILGSAAGEHPNLITHA